MDHYEPSRPRRYPQRDRPPPPPSGPQGDMFQFRGAAGARPAGDSYRPGDHGRRNEFNFSAGGNAPSFAPSDNYPRARRNNRPRDRPRDGRANRPPPRRFGPKPAHERDLMRRGREPTPEQLEGMNEGQSSRFKVLEDLSDSESEAEHDDMDVESAQPVANATVDDAENSDGSEDDHPRAKRARIQSPVPAAKPQWSNPDPYTVLPPPDESQTKKKDVVKLIRKAKVDAPKPAATASEGADFISLNFDDDFAQDDSDDGQGDVSFSGSARDGPSLPQKPSFSHLDNLHPDRAAPPPAAEEPKGVNVSLPLGRLDTWPPPPDVHGSDPLGRSQFNTGLQRQDAKDAAAPLRKDTKKRKRRDDAGTILDEWLTPEDTDPTPWFNNRPQGSRAEKWLHNEILDFHDYVKPRDFENQVREDLVQRMDRAVKSEFPNLNIRAFGSFASGLYLPTADMDVVACSTPFLNRGFSTLSPSRNWLFKFANRLKKAGVAVETSVTVIWGARVPLVKFVEKVTGLRVDVSFENDSGLVANNTFQVWKQEYPAMPIIVSLIKQFLVMRGFSEVFTGGLGGYSVICLTITILRILEQRNGPGWDPMQNLDAVLMTFLVHYGRDFDVEKDGIQMDPWQIVGKHYWKNSFGKGSKPDRLLIIDPNNYDNDISGGSANIIKIFEKFDEAFRDLNICMSDAEDNHKETGGVISILERVWGGNYALFEAQRARLKGVWQQNMASGSRFPRGNNNQGGNSRSGNQGQGKPGNHNPGNQGKQNNQPKQGKRPADGDSRPNKKQKTNENGLEREPLYLAYEETTAETSGPAQAVGQRKKSADASAGAQNKASATTDQPQPGTGPKKAPKKSKKDKKKDKDKDRVKSADEIKQEQDRAESFKKSHPSVTNIPDRLDKKEFKKLRAKHSKSSQQ